MLLAMKSYFLVSKDFPDHRRILKVELITYLSENRFVH